MKRKTAQPSSIELFVIGIICALSVVGAGLLLAVVIGEYAAPSSPPASTHP